MRSLIIALLLAYAHAAVSEPSTKIPFPEVCKLPGMSKSQALCGLGCRCKKIGPASVNVYAVGMYADKVELTKDLKGFKGKEPDSALINAVKNSGFEKTLVLKMSRTVGKDKMVGALGESVKPRMKSDHAALESFQGILQRGIDAHGGTANEGMQLSFALKAGSLHVGVNGDEAGSVSSKELCGAMIDTYLDEKAVSPDAKASILRGICDSL